jgi:hypothetical protein
MTEIGPEQLRGMFDAMASSAFRLEARRSYALGYERPVFEAFVAGQDPLTPPELDWWRPWLERVARVTAAGRRIRRVRLVDSPPTDYQRFGIWSGAWNVAAGEDIRYLSRAVARQAGIPDDKDWWLFDSAALVRMRFDDDGDLAGRDLVTDLGRVAVYQELQDLAMALAVPATELAA